MFKKPTVYILGAGASWHYGYPTGEGLVDKIINTTRLFKTLCDVRMQSAAVLQSVPRYVEEIPSQLNGVSGTRDRFAHAIKECDQLLDRLETVRPLVIDYFLGWNPPLQRLGKMMIAASLIKCEVDSSGSHKNINRPRDGKKHNDDWIRFLVHQIAMGCKNSKDLFQNDVYFITFNYDRSLEVQLFSALNAIEMFDHADIIKFMNDQRVVHVYGTIHQSISTANNDKSVPGAKTMGARFSNDLAALAAEKEYLDRSFDASNGIRTIDPHDKRDEHTLQTAADLISAAECVYILGFGFDEQNCERLNLNASLRRPGTRSAGKGKRKTIMFTNYGDINRVNKAASRLFLGRPNGFSQGTFIEEAERSFGYYFEKSIRNCYDALAMDFDEAESS